MIRAIRDQGWKAQRGQYEGWGSQGVGELRGWEEG